MDMRKLGANGPLVNPLGYGAMSFSDFYGPTDTAESHAILDMARDNGVNHLDTANVYGPMKSELAIGSYFQANPAAKSEFVIATKASIKRREDGPGNVFDNSPEHLEAELDKSLERMGIDAVDLFYIHRREADRPIEDVAETMGKIVAKGKAKSIGFSEISPASLRRAHAVHPVAAVQSEYSLQTRLPELGMLQTCAELGVAFVAFSPVGRSYLTDTPLSYEAVQELPFLKVNPRFSADNYPRNIAETDKLRALAAEMGMSTAGLANAWVLAKGDHIITIPGTRSTTHFTEILDANTRSLTKDEVAKVEEVLPVGWCHGDRYSVGQWTGPECYC